MLEEEDTMSESEGQSRSRQTIGIIGGMNYQSTMLYYEHIHQVYQAKFGDQNYPRVIVYSLPFADYLDWYKRRAWAEASETLSDAAGRLTSAGADLALIASNTMHIAFETVQANSPIPLLHVADPVAEAIKLLGLTTVGLLGTQTTMQHPFFRDRLAANGIGTLVPPLDAQIEGSRIIFQELAAGVVRPESKSVYLGIMAELARRGAGGFVLACPELPLLVQPSDSSLPLFDSTKLHAEAALAEAVGITLRG
jgi:aspartate racemase